MITPGSGVIKWGEVMLSSSQNTNFYLCVCVGIYIYIYQCISELFNSPCLTLALNLAIDLPQSQRRV